MLLLKHIYRYSESLERGFAKIASKFYPSTGELFTCTTPNAYCEGDTKDTMIYSCGTLNKLYYNYILFFKGWHTVCEACYLQIKKSDGESNKIDYVNEPDNTWVYTVKCPHCRSHLIPFPILCDLKKAIKSIV